MRLLKPTKPPYSAQDLKLAVEGLETLERLQEKTLQAIRLNGSLDADQRRELVERYNRYGRNIQSRQQLILHIERTIQEP